MTPKETFKGAEGNSDHERGWIWVIPHVFAAKFRLCCSLSEWNWQGWKKQGLTEGALCPPSLLCQREEAGLQSQIFCQWDRKKQGCQVMLYILTDQHGTCLLERKSHWAQGFQTMWTDVTLGSYSTSSSIWKLALPLGDESHRKSSFINSAWSTTPDLKWKNTGFTFSQNNSLAYTKFIKSICARVSVTKKSLQVYTAKCKHEFMTPNCLAILGNNQF